MTVSILDLHCLSAVTDDQEGVASMLEEVRRTSHGNACWSEVVAALDEMAAAGLLAASSFEPGGSRFVPAVRSAIDSHMNARIPLGPEGGAA